MFSQEVLDLARLQVNNGPVYDHSMLPVFEQLFAAGEIHRHTNIVWYDRNYEYTYYSTEWAWLIHPNAFLHRSPNQSASTI